MPLAVTRGFAPLAVLFSFVLRISTVAQYTASTAQFVTPSEDS